MNEPKVCEPYKDGNPLGRPAHRHINPDGSEGGWVAERAHVAPGVYVGPQATIRGGSIHGGSIYGGTIYGSSIRGGTIRTDRDLLVLGPVGSEDQHVTLVRTDTGHRLTIGCWNGENTVDDLAAEVQRRCPDRADEYAEIETILRRRVAEWEQEA